jgi:hypothetical protein
VYEQLLAQCVSYTLGWTDVAPWQQPSSMQRMSGLVAAAYPIYSAMD